MALRSLTAARMTFDLLKYVSLVATTTPLLATSKRRALAGQRCCLLSRRQAARGRELR